MITTLQIEIAVAKYFNPRQNLIVPNVWWGLGFNHELDLMVLTKSGYAYEIEIKTSRSDIMADLKKCHAHGSDRIARLYFAVPDELAGDENIPDRAGIIAVSKWPFESKSLRVKKIREAVRNNNAIRLNDRDTLHLAKLGAMRIWNLKQRVVNCD